VSKTITEADPKKEEVRQFFAKARAGDQTALARVREMVREPHMLDLLGGNLVKDTRQLMMKTYCGDDIIVRTALEHTLKTMRDELAGPHPSPLENLLVERIVTCWLQLHIVESRYANTKEMSFAASTHFQQHIDRANARYLKAIKTLATVRKLAVPVLQVNIAERQVNVGAKP
jgi:hypothetical protein